MGPGAISLRIILRAGPICCMFAVIVASTPAAARDLTIGLRSDMGGFARAGLIDSFVAPFTTSTGVNVNVVDRPSDPAIPRDDAPPWDVVQLNGPDLINACAQGTVEKLDWTAIGGRDRMLARAASDCGMGAFLRATVLAWDRDKFQATPTWTDFGDIAKNPGKRGLRRGVVGNLEIALLADGVAPADVYSTLRGTDGIERAFRKLDQLKPYLVFWSDAGDKPVDAVKILGSGEVLMTSAPVEQVVDADRAGHRNFGIQWNGALSDIDSWAIVKGSPNLADAQKFLLFAGDSKVQGRLLNSVAFGGAARAGADGLPPDLLAIDPAAPANLAMAVPLDLAFWHDNFDKLSPRFEAWLAR